MVSISLQFLRRAGLGTLLALPGAAFAFPDPMPVAYSAPEPSPLIVRIPPKTIGGAPLIGLAASLADMRSLSGTPAMPLCEALQKLAPDAIEHTKALCNPEPG